MFQSARRRLGDRQTAEPGKHGAAEAVVQGSNPFFTAISAARVPSAAEFSWVAKDAVATAGSTEGGINPVSVAVSGDAQGAVLLVQSSPDPGAD